MVLGGSLKFLVVLSWLWMGLGGTYYLLVVLGGSMGFLMVFGGSWWFLVGFSGCLCYFLVPSILFLFFVVLCDPWWFYGSWLLCGSLWFLVVLVVFRG